jgi:hypothetical protein
LLPAQLQAQVQLPRNSFPFLAAADVVAVAAADADDAAAVVVND